MEERESHRTMKVWLVIMVGSILVSSALMVGGPAVTGMAISFDTGPTADFNPDRISSEEMYAQASNGALLLLVMVAVQASVYYGVRRWYG